MTSVDLLILGAGWMSTFLIPLCNSRLILYAATSRTGRDNTIAFEFDPHSDDPAPFELLPNAQTVLITFPIKVPGASARLVKLYEQTRHRANPTRESQTAYIQLGSTGIWDGEPTIEAGRHYDDVWTDRHSSFDETNERARAEMELLALAPAVRTTVLDLCGLWGGQRQLRNWVSRVAPNKDVLKHKGSIHMIHGLDVARAVLAVQARFERASGERWLLTDGRVYDWWDLASAWGEEGKQGRWVRELMDEEGVRALPRTPQVIGRAMDSREFWREFELEPVKGRLGEE